MNIRFVSAAYEELNDAINYYDHQLPGLGFRFYQEVSSSIEIIKLLPDAWTKVSQKTRRCILKSFPFAILYVIEGKEIIITAIAQFHRNPEHYKNRII